MRANLTLSSRHLVTQSLLQRFPEKFSLALVLALAATLRLTNLAHNPGWYTDEATHLNLAQHLLRGQAQYFAITQSFLLFGRMPLFEWLLAGALALGGDGLLTLRALTGALGVVTVGVLYWAARPLSRRLALLAALLLAIYPSAVLYSRFGFSYNLLAPLVLVVWRGLGSYWLLGQRRWLGATTLVVGLGLLSDLWMGVLIAPVLIVIVLRRWRDALWALPWLALPGALYVASQLIFTPRAFLFDVRFTLARLNAIPVTQQAATVMDNLLTLFGQEAWWLAGLAGLALLNPAPARYLALALFIAPLLLLGRTVALYSLSFYYMIPLLPMAALGSAALIHHAARLRWHLAVGVLALFMAALPATLRQISTGFVTPIDDFLINPTDARAAADFVNQHSHPDDVIIASPAVAWLLQTHAADFQMAVAATGQATVHLPANIPADRFAFDPRFENARYIIIDNLWRNWAAIHIPAVAEMMPIIEQWPIAFQSSAMVVYRNPKSNLTQEDDPDKMFMQSRGLTISDRGSKVSP